MGCAGGSILMRRFLTTLLITVSLGVSILSPAVLVSQTAAAACPSSILGITVWYRGLTDSNCHVKSPGNGQNDLSIFITKIILNVIQAALAAAAYVAVFFIIKGGFAYMTSAGSPDGVSGAKKTITEAVIGLLIVLLSAVIVNTIVGIL